MKLKRGSTSVRRLIFIADSSSTVGAGLASLTYNSSGLVAYYFAGDLSNEVQITLASATLGSFTSGGLVAVDNTNMPGWYEIGIPDAALDAGNEVAIQLRGATNMVPVNIYIELDAVDYQTTAFGALTTLGTNAPANWLNTAAFADGTLTAAKFASGAFDAVWTVTTRTLSAAGVQAIWDAATSALTTVGSIGKLFVDKLTSVAQVGSAMTLTSGERTTLAGAIEVEFLDDLSGDQFLAGVMAQIQTLFDQGTDVPVSTIVALTAAAVRTEMDSNSTKLAAINSKTTNLPAAPAAVGDIPTAAAVRTEMDSNSTKLAALKKLLEADKVIDTGSSPWALVYLERGTGGLGEGTELLRQELTDVNGDPIDSISTFVANSVSP